MILFLQLFFALWAVALPSTLSPRDGSDDDSICSGKNGAFVLYHEYHSDVCPPHKVIQSDGNCGEPASPWLQGCSSYCQVRTNFEYTTEQILPIGWCRGPYTCTVTESQTTTTTLNLNVKIPIPAVYANVDITGGYSMSNGVTRTKALSVKLESWECGYMSFIPIRRTTCGSATERKLVSLGPFSAICVDPKTTENVCLPQLVFNKDGTVNGETIFVKTDCVTREPYPDAMQDPIYSKPGVKLDRGTALFQLLSLPIQGAISACVPGGTCKKTDGHCSAGCVPCSCDNTVCVPEGSGSNGAGCL